MDTLRIGDNERDLTVQTLTEHFAAGRLTRDELDQRTGAALIAQSGSDLAALLRDLPRLTPRQQVATKQEISPTARKARLLWRTAGLAPWALFVFVFILIWAVTGAGYFWPIWPIMGWGIGVVVTGILAHVLPEMYLEQQAARGMTGCRRSG